jgi:hypothetical protein
MVRHRKEERRKAARRSRQARKEIRTRGIRKADPMQIQMRLHHLRCPVRLPMQRRRMAGLKAPHMPGLTADRRGAQPAPRKVLRLGPSPLS